MRMRRPLTLFVDHLRDIWLGLEPSERGSFYTRGRDSADRAAHHGIAVRHGCPPRSRNRVLVASWGDVPAIGRRRFFMVEHGSGQVYSPEPPAGTSPDLVHNCGLDLLLAPNERVRWRNELHHHHARSVVVGSAKVERYAALRVSRVESRVPVVAFCWHWNAPGPTAAARWAWPVWRDAVAELASVNHGLHLIGSGHPKAWRHLSHWYRRCGIETVPDLEDVIRRADVVVADNTSAMWEAAACGIPVVILDAPWYADATGEPRFGVGKDAGVRVGSGTAAELHGAVTITLAADPCADARRDAVSAIYGDVRGSLERSLAAIRALP